MADHPTQRRLAAILAADVAGYTRLMEEDSDATVNAWQSARDSIIDPTITSHSGRIVKLTGDGFLAEFPTVQDAVNCAIKMQESLKSSSLEFRMGVNLGDIIDDGKDIHGEGVNVAARIEALADSGGVSISGSVYEQVRNRIDAIFEDRGEQSVKNISAPVRVYAISLHQAPDSVPASQERTITDKPSIAVLPFDNLSGDPEQEYFSDGIVEAIITDLSKLTGISVIARNSSFTYKGKSVDIRDVARELEVSHVLEGSVQKSANRVRITAQLIDAISNSHLWADRYDGNMDDVFSLQDEISQKIVGSLQINLDIVEAERLSSSRAPVKEAYDYFVRGKIAIHPPSPPQLREAKVFFNNAVDIDPEFSGGHAGLALVSGISLLFTKLTSAPVDQSLEETMNQAKRAVSMDPNFGWAYVPLSMVHLLRREHDLAVQVLSNGLVVSPGDADLNAYMGYMLIWNNRNAEACEYIEVARKLDPHHPAFRLYHAYAKFGVGNYSETIELIGNQVPVSSYSPISFIYLIVAHIRQGNQDQAEAVLKRALARYEFISIKKLQNFLPFADKKYEAELLDDLSTVLPVA